MFLDSSTLRSLRKRYAKSSIKTINSNMKRLFRDGLGKDTFDKVLLSKRFSKIRDYIAGLEKSSVQKSMLHNIRAIIGKDHKGYNKLIELYNIINELERGIMPVSGTITGRIRRGVIDKGVRK